MKMSDKYARSKATLKYKLDCDNDRFCESEMKLCTAEEVVRSATSLRVDEEMEGYELVVNERMYFPLEAFEFGEGELPVPKPKAKAKPKPKE